MPFEQIDNEAKNVEKQNQLSSKILDLLMDAPTKVAQSQINDGTKITDKAIIFGEKSVSAAAAQENAASHLKDNLSSAQNKSIANSARIQESIHAESIMNGSSRQNQIEKNPNSLGSSRLDQMKKQGENSGFPNRENLNRQNFESEERWNLYRPLYRIPDLKNEQQIKSLPSGVKFELKNQILWA